MNRYKKLSKEEKDKIKEYQRKRYQQLIQYKKGALQNKWRRWNYRESEIVKPLCIILPQMTGYLKYFENEGKTYLS